MALSSRDVGFRGVELVLTHARVDEGALAVHLLRALVEPPARPAVTLRLRRARALELVGEDRFLHVDGHAAEGVDDIAELEEVDHDHVIDRQACEVPRRADREGGAAERVGGVDLLLSLSRDGHAEVAGDGEERDPVFVRIRADDHDRVGSEGPLALRALVDAENEDGRGVGKEEAVLVGEGAERAGVEALVRGLDSAPEREIAEQRPHGDGEEEHREDDEPDAQPPAAPSRTVNAVAGAPVPPVGALGPLLRDLAGNGALDASASVDAVRLVFGGHSDRVS
jgi:hypothetical protein